MIRVLYFASFRERLNIDSEQVQPEGIGDVASLLRLLRQREGVWSEIFAEDQIVMMAVNQEMVDLYAPVKDGDEVALFPPVTGG
jgi:molybdopterin synthase sulfur carrier subunit